MRKISRPRVFLAGLLGGMAIDFIEYLVDAFVSPDRWNGAAEALNKLLTTMPSTSEASAKPDTALVIALLQVVGLAAGFAGARSYVAFSRWHRRRLLAAIAGWVVTYAPVSVVVVWLKLISGAQVVRDLALFAGSSLVACLMGVTLGGWIYEESEAASKRAAARVAAPI